MRIVALLGLVVGLLACAPSLPRGVFAGDAGPEVSSSSEVGTCESVAGGGCACNALSGTWWCVGNLPVCVCQTPDVVTPSDEGDVVITDTGVPETSVDVGVDVPQDAEADAPPGDAVDVATLPDSGPDVVTDTPSVDVVDVQDVADTAETCPSPFVSCTGSCVNPSADSRNCGGCGRVCSLSNATAGCTSGSCVVTLCAHDFGDCDHNSSNGCEQPLGSDNLNCGACGRACPSGTACVGGACAGVCPVGQTFCAGSCVELSTSSNCGACGNVCGGGQVCLGGVCGCLPDQILCGGACVSPSTDNNNCGRCGVSCSGGGRTCVGGTCGCGAGQMLCGSTCYNTLSDVTHCGGCGGCPSVVNGSPTCSLGHCGFACNFGYVSNGTACVLCGASGAPACSGGCNAGLTNCGGTCRDLTSDSASCGVCGNVCLGSAACSSGICLEQASCRVAGTPGCGLVEIATGMFNLGDVDSSSLNALPAQVGVRVSTFAMDASEVTVARFAAFWAAGHPYGPTTVVYPSGPVTTDNVVVEPLTTGLCNWRVSGRESHPLNCVTWATAAAFCAWDGGRLPTEAEWEFASRRTSGAPYPWRTTGLPGDRACWSGSVGRTGTCVVGSFLSGSTPEGLNDMAGNVWEWTADWYRVYSDTLCWGNTHLTNPMCAVSNSFHSFRGGGWDSSVPGHLRSMSRNPVATSFTDRAVGFRCAHSQ